MNKDRAPVDLAIGRHNRSFPRGNQVELLAEPLRASSPARFMPENPSVTDWFGVSETHSKYSCEVLSDRSACDLSPGLDRKVSWSLDELLAFLCKLELPWGIHSSGRWIPHRARVSGILPVDVFSRDLEQNYLLQIIHIQIPVRYTYVAVRVTQDWLFAAQAGWKVASNPRPCELDPPRTQGMETYIARKQISRCYSKILIRAETMLVYSGGMWTVLSRVLDHLGCSGPIQLFTGEPPETGFGILSCHSVPPLERRDSAQNSRDFSG
jgi:hypothetical protein